MNHRTSRRLFVVVSLASTLVSSAHAEDTKDDKKKACTGAYAQAQSLRDAHKLVDAREQLRICSQPACTAFIVKDCTAWLEAVEASLPTIVFSASDGAGHELTDVRVSVEGKPLASMLDGRAVPVDPGLHTFRFERADGSFATPQTLVKEGDKNVSVAVTLQQAAAIVPAATAELPPAPPTQASSESPAHAGSGRGTRRTMGIVVGAVGLAGLGAGAVLGWMASSKWSAAKAACPTFVQCNEQAMRDHDAIAPYATASTIGFIAGGVLAAVGVTMILTAPKAGTPSVALTAAPRAVGLAGRF